MMDWWYEFPSQTLRWKIDGEQNKRLKGNALSLLRLVKERMKLRSLYQLRATRVFNTGEVIVVESVCGMDVITIRSTKGIGIPEIKETCSITFLDMPEIVQPMRNPGEIATGEVKGIDYIKTYYFFTSECPQCFPMEMKLEFLYSEADAEPDIALVLTLSETDTNHCQISMDGRCWAEIIEQGVDSGGPYFIWKAYTEHGMYSRSGLGVLLIYATLGSSTHPLLCKTASPVTVDCCHKDKYTRQVKIYWENCSEGVDDIIVWGGMQLCPIPAVVCEGDFALYINDKKVFYILPDIDGGCLPFTWFASSGEIIAPYPGLFATYIPPPEGPNGVNIRAHDRCGTWYGMVISCCDCPGYTPPLLLYDSLTMGCGETQTLHVLGGCPPYTWDPNPGCGTLSDPYGDNYSYIDYTSPVNNDECECQPVIRVQDNCDEAVELHLAVSCVVNMDALKVCYLTVTGAHKPTKEECGGTQCCHAFYRVDTYTYGCDGTISWECHAGPLEVGCWYFDCAIPATEDGACSDAGVWDWLAQYGSPGGYCSGCNCGTPPIAWNCYWDERAENGLLHVGCCPYNPFTGEPL